MQEKKYTLCEKNTIFGSQIFFQCSLRHLEEKKTLLIKKDFNVTKCHFFFRKIRKVLLYEKG